MLGSTKLILLSNGAMSDHCFPLSESYQFPRVPVCKEERAESMLSKADAWTIKKLPSRNLHVVILAFKDTYLVLVVVLLMLIMMLMLMLMILLK